jgi:hypothetical protein
LVKHPRGALISCFSSDCSNIRKQPQRSQAPTVLIAVCGIELLLQQLQLLGVHAPLLLLLLLDLLLRWVLLLCTRKS